MEQNLGQTTFLALLKVHSKLLVTSNHLTLQISGATSTEALNYGGQVKSVMLFMCIIEMVDGIGKLWIHQTSMSTLFLFFTTSCRHRVTPSMSPTEAFISGSRLAGGTYFCSSHLPSLGGAKVGSSSGRGTKQLWLQS